MKTFLFLMLLSSVCLAGRRFTPVKIETACDMSTATCTSIGTDINQLSQYTIQAVYTGSPVGTFTLQVSTDQVPTGVGADPASNVVNWTTYTGSSQAISAAGNFVWNVFPAGYHWVRLLYTKTSGTGSLSAEFNGKE